MEWSTPEAMKTLPVPEDGVIYVFADGSQKEKPGKKNPVAQKGRKSKWYPWLFGIRLVILMAGWDVSRIAVSFGLILPQGHADHKTENALFREMVKRFEPPAWPTFVIVGGDAADGSKENLKMVQPRNQPDRDRCWRFVFGIAWTRRCEDGKRLKGFVTYLPLTFYQRTWRPKLAGERPPKTCWIFGKRMSWNHIGDVMVVLSRKGRNLEPEKNKLIVTNLTEVRPRQVIYIYQRRSSVELLIWERKSGLGLGQHQVSRNEDRIEKSFGITIRASLFLLWVSSSEILPGHC